MRPDRYTPAENAAILAGVAAGTPWRRLAAELGRSRSGLMERAAALGRRPLPGGVRRDRRWWTAAERAYLFAWWGLKPDRAVAHRLGRTVGACAGQAKQSGAARRRNVTPPWRLARVFGVTDWVVHRWIALGWLYAQRSVVRAARGTVMGHVPDAALRRFVAERPWAYDVAKMQSGHWLTEVARAVQAADPWLPLAEAAAVVSYGVGTLRQWVRDGWLPARHRARVAQRQGTAGAYGYGAVVRRSDLLATAARAPELRRARLAAVARPD